jgi:hypothetical protein
VPLHPCVLVPPTTMSWGPGASTIDRHDCVFPRERHHVAPAWVFIEFCTTDKGPQDHETLHHATVLELVPHGVCVVWVGLLEDSFGVICRWPHLTLVTSHDSRDAPPVGAAYLPVVAIVMVVAPWGHWLCLLL